MMIMYSKKMILGLVSGHIPLIKIKDYLKSKIISNKNHYSFINFCNPKIGKYLELFDKYLFDVTFNFFIIKL